MPPVDDDPPAERDDELLGPVDPVDERVEPDAESDDDPLVVPVEAPLEFVAPLLAPLVLLPLVELLPDPDREADPDERADALPAPSSPVVAPSELALPPDAEGPVDPAVRPDPPLDALGRLPAEDLPLPFESSLPNQSM